MYRLYFVRASTAFGETFASCKSMTAPLVPGEKNALLSSENAVVHKSDTAIELGVTQSPEIAGELQGYILLLASTFGFTTMSVFVRLASGFHGLPVFTNMLIRGIMQSTFAIALAAIFMDFRKTFTVTRKQFCMLALRGFLGTSALFCVFASLSLIPLGVQASLFFLSTYIPPPTALTLLTSIGSHDFVLFHVA